MAPILFCGIVQFNLKWITAVYSGQTQEIGGGRLGKSSTMILSLSFSGSAILPVLNAEGQKTQMTIDQTKAVRTGTILKEASEALAAKDPPAFADVLIELIQLSPKGGPRSCF